MTAYGASSRPAGPRTQPDASLPNRLCNICMHYQIASTGGHSITSAQTFPHSSCLTIPNTLSLLSLQPLTYNRPRHSLQAPPRTLVTANCSRSCSHRRHGPFGTCSRFLIKFLKPILQSVVPTGSQITVLTLYRRYAWKLGPHT